MSVEDYLTTTEMLKKKGSLDYALGMLHVLNRYASENGDYVLRDECRKRINKYEYRLESVRYNVETGASSPVNREPESAQKNETVITSSPCPVGHKTFTFSIEGETRNMMKNRLAQARIILINGKYMDAGKGQWTELFSGYTTHEKIKWTGEKGHLKYFIQAIQKNIKNLTGFGIWEIVAAHFMWYYTYPKSKKTVEEYFNHIRLSQGKAKQAKELDEAASWFKPEKNPNYKPEGQEEKNPYTYNNSLTDSEEEYDAWGSGLDVPPKELLYPTNDEDKDDPDFCLSDEY